MPPRSVDNINTLLTIRISPDPLERSFKLRAILRFFLFFLFFFLNLDSHDSFYHAETTKIEIERDVGHSANRILSFSCISDAMKMNSQWSKLDGENIFVEGKARGRYYSSLGVVTRSYRRLHCTFVLSFAISFMDLDIYTGKACSLP